jgi:Domain of unknown function (DUF4124)
MIATVKRLGLVIGLTLLLSSPVSAGEIYQWTDINGIVHFTDNLNWVPELARNSSNLIVRRDLPTNASPAVEVRPISPEPLTTPEPGPTLQPLPYQAEVSPPLYAPQEVTIVVVNNGHRHLRKHPCGGAHCKPVFRPDFNNRQYIHPSVFSGGSRQYIHPR